MSSCFCNCCSDAACLIANRFGPVENGDCSIDSCVRLFPQNCSINGTLPITGGTVVNARPEDYWGWPSTSELLFPLVFMVVIVASVLLFLRIRRQRQRASSPVYPNNPADSSFSVVIEPPKAYGSELPKMRSVEDPLPPYQALDQPLSRGLRNVTDNADTHSETSITPVPASSDQNGEVHYPSLAHVSGRNSIQ